MRYRLPVTSTISFFIILLVFLQQVFAQEQDIERPELNGSAIVGTIFGASVPASNYLFIRSVFVIFGNRWGPRPTTPQDYDKYTWEQLLLSFEAFRRGITIDPKEIEEEIDKILKKDRVEFDWKNDKEAYGEWVKKKTGVTAETFKNHMQHLLQIHKLREQVKDSIKPHVTNKEAYQEFLDENNSLEVELIRFDELEDAKRFYKKAKKDRKFWEQEKEKSPKEFKHPGKVSLEYLTDLWKFPRDACYKMLKMRKGAIYPPAPIYKGYAVFKILGKRAADKSGYKKRKEFYYKQIEGQKKYEGLARWIEDLKEQANIKVYEDVLAKFIGPGAESEEPQEGNISEKEGVKEKRKK